MTYSDHEFKAFRYTKLCTEIVRILDGDILGCQEAGEADAHERSGRRRPAVLERNIGSTEPGCNRCGAGGIDIFSGNVEWLHLLS